MLLAEEGVRKVQGVRFTQVGQTRITIAQQHILQPARQRRGTVHELSGGREQRAKIVLLLVTTHHQVDGVVDHTTSGLLVTTIRMTLHVQLVLRRIEQYVQLTHRTAEHVFALLVGETRVVEIVAELVGHTHQFAAAHVAHTKGFAEQFAAVLMAHHRTRDGGVHRQQKEHIVPTQREPLAAHLGSEFAQIQIDHSAHLGRMVVADRRRSNILDAHRVRL
mmetsp:Transcript_14479/g.36928  ORF Transcript_14479/g.36928 Transcript_14479/m.36928 type:complete len:220 (-) Transcript_14479:2059-2718(-)